jgi:hypothetical protein
VREEQSVGGDGLHESLFVAAVAPVVVVVNHGDLLPGQSVELAGPAAVVGATFVQVGGVVAWSRGACRASAVTTVPARSTSSI